MSNEKMAIEITKTYLLLTKKDSQFENELEFTNLFAEYYDSVLNILNSKHQPEKNKISVGYNSIT